MKQHVKKILLWLFILIALPFYLLYLLQSVITSKDQSTLAWSQLLSLFPGMTGNYLRAAFYSLAFKHTSQEVVISFGTLFSQQDTNIGYGAYIGPQCNIGKCQIADNCLLGSGVHIMSGKQQHSFDDPDVPLREQGGVFTKVTIGEDTWIGNGALIMANVGKKCVVGAGSVVINPIPDFSIVGGNPAKILGTRKPQDP
jgi:acetyltransferase-like isoleucine patch superfamily enzyme